jgi:hypothetical protein
LRSAKSGGKGAVAQLVEQRTENPCVGGSIPPHTTDNIEMACKSIFYKPFLFLGALFGTLVLGCFNLLFPFAF